ncbi:fla cluster protein FlaF [Halogeometricum limi]|uniref:Flagellar protein FlaF n=1 Tax=Halogeometricum limi TaxID=555875 RepID=A0A1I6GNT2_9EURY|nr:fla cluster protein FlaF [Halogeometricum limi]SFR43883.1 flagellar protein FlaF [Halogeometricum limi]
MGFGVSGSTAIIFLGVLVCTGTLYTAAAGSAEQLSDARDATDERLLDQRNTAINITSASYTNNNGSYPTSIEVENTGTTTLSVNDTSLLVDNEYRALSNSTVLEVDGTAGTDIWAPGETLLVEFSGDDAPQRVKFVTEYGVADANETVVN